MVIIGVDPHPASHTAAVLDENGKILDHKTVHNDQAGIQALSQWAAVYPKRIWAIEGASNPFSRALCTHLLGRDEQLHHIHPSMTSQYRSRQTKAKTDEIDAENAARVLLANPHLPRYRQSVQHHQLQVLTRTRFKLARQLKANRMALQQLPETDVLSAARTALQQVMESLSQAIKQLEAQLRLLVQKECPGLLRPCGIGAVVAATILAEIGDINRFQTRDQFARYCGAAPVPRGSGGTWRWCVNPGGNRRMNYVLHIIVLTRMRFDDRTKQYVIKHRNAGKPLRAILRNLKTIVAREVFTLLHRAVSPVIPLTQA